MCVREVSRLCQGVLCVYQWGDMCVLGGRQGCVRGYGVCIRGVTFVCYGGVKAVSGGVVCVSVG